MILRVRQDDLGVLIALAIRGARTERENAELARLGCELDRDSVAAIAQRRQVEALIGQAFAEVAPDSQLARVFAELLRRNNRRVETIIQDLSLLGPNLQSVGIGHAAIESGGVLLSGKSPLSAFSSGDIDLVVSSADEKQVAAVFAGGGYKPAGRAGRARTSRREYERIVSGVGRLRISAGPKVYERVFLPLGFTVPESDWIARRVESARAPGVYVLDPTDLLVQVCLHASLHSYARAPGIRLFVDIDRLIRETTIDWASFTDAVRAMAVVPRVAAALGIAAGILDTPIPLSVLDEMQSASKRVTGVFWLVKNRGLGRSDERELSNVEALVMDALLDGHGLGHWLLTVVGSLVRPKQKVKNAQR